MYLILSVDIQSQVRVLYRLLNYKSNWLQLVSPVVSPCLEAMAVFLKTFL